VICFFFRCGSSFVVSIVLCIWLGSVDWYSRFRFYWMGWLLGVIRLRWLMC